MLIQTFRHAIFAIDVAHSLSHLFIHSSESIWLLYKPNSETASLTDRTDTTLARNSFIRKYHNDITVFTPNMKSAISTKFTTQKKKKNICMYIWITIGWKNRFPFIQICMCVRVILAADTIVYNYIHIHIGRASRESWMKLKLMLIRT